MLRDWLLRARSLFRRSSVEAEMDAELRHHIERETEKLVAAGLTREEATRRARIELGGLEQVREDCRDARGTRLLESVVEDARIGLRTLRKSPAFTLTAMLTLALGIGANTAVLSVVNAILWRGLPFPESSRILSIHESHTRPTKLTGATFHDLEATNRTFSEVADYRLLPKNLGDASSGTAPEEINVAFVSRSFFALLRTPPQIGRVPGDAEFRANGPKAMLLSYTLWQRRYHGDPSIVGRMEMVHGQPCLVAGVMPAGFAFPEDAAAWAPLQDDEMIPQNRRAHLFATIGRLRDNTSLPQALADLHAASLRIAQADPNGDPGMELAAEPLEQALNAGVRPTLLMLLGAVAIVLAMACANVANLQLSRAAVRQKALAVRAALGASRARLVRQLLTESALLGVLGGVAGCVAGVWLARLLFAAYPGALPHLTDPIVDGEALAASVLAALLAAVLAGIVPAFQLSRTDLRKELVESGRSTGSSLRHRLRSGLIVGQIALALVLVVSAGLLVRTMVMLARVNPGYEPKGLTVVSVSLPGSRYPDLAHWQRFVDRANQDLRAIPGVTSAAATGGMPFRPIASTDFDIQGRTFAPGDEPEAQIVPVTPDFFATLGIRLLAGRSFSNRDVLGAPTAVVINEAMAKQIWPNENPIGKHLTLKDWGDPLPGEVVGVVADARQDALDRPAQPSAYYSMAQFPEGTLTIYFFVRAPQAQESLATAIRQKIWALDSALPADVEPFERVIADSVERRRFTLALLAAFAGIAVLLAVVGVYGLVAYWVEQRAQELGIRMALGAQARDVLRLVLGEGFRLSWRGLMLGVLAGLAFTRLLAGLLFGVEPADPITFIGAAVALGAATLVACWLPARRAMRADPLSALRHE